MASEKPSWQQDKEDEEKEDEEEVDDNAYIAQKDAVIFAIEVSESMMADPPAVGDTKAETDTPAAAALKCAYRMMQDRIISNPKDMMGILLFGTEKSKFQNEDETSRGGLSFPHCYLLADLDIPDAATVKLIKRLTDDSDPAAKRELLKPSKEPLSMSNLLFCANQLFTTKAPNFGSRRLFIITDNDNPHAEDKALRNTAAVRAKDLSDLGVFIELFPISKLDHEFDRSAFYDDIVYPDPNPDAVPVTSSALKPASMNDGMTLLTSLISSIKSKQTPKRALFSKLVFEIGEGLRISVKGYNIIERQKPARSSWIWQGDEKAQIAQVESTRQAEDTTRTVDKKEQKYAYKFAGTHVLFGKKIKDDNDKKKKSNDDIKDEYEQLRDFMDEPRPGEKPMTAILRIIGFKPDKMLPIWAALKKSTFIYPSEDDFVGSTRVFAALHQKLLKDKLMGLAWFIARKNATPLIVAILPSAEIISKNGQQISPAGLWLYPLPFADDIRNLPTLPAPIVADDSLIDQISIAIKQLQLPNGAYDPSLYPNPALQWHYKIIQAMALDEELPAAPEDKTLPKYRQIDKRAATYIARWKKLLDEQHLAHVKNRPEPPSKKRGSSEPSSTANKRVKKEDPGDDGGKYSLEDMKALTKKNKVTSCSVKDLKDFCKDQGLPITGLKAVLVERVEEFCEGK